jgi:hypothetical protein
VEHEMKWTILYFKFQETTWIKRADVTNFLSLGHTSYAMQQATMYRLFAEQAEVAFEKARNIYSPSRMGL